MFTDENNGVNTHNRSIIKTPHFDSIGYTVKLGKARTHKSQSSCHWSGRYEALDEEQKLAFETLNSLPTMKLYLAVVSRLNY